MGSDQKQTKEIPLNGKWITSVDGVEIGDNFTTLQNLRYSDTGLRPVGGMTARTTNPLSKTTPMAGYHFRKTAFGTDETHVLVQSTTGAAADIVQNLTAIGSSGDFSSTVVYSGVHATNAGTFSEAPGGAVAFCDGTNTLIWGGTEREISSFVNYHPDGDWKYDYSEVLQNSMSDIDNTAPLYSGSDSLDASTKGLYHFDNAATDSTANANNLTATSLTYSDTIYKFATHSALFNGSSSRLSRADTADFNFSGGIWTVECWLRISAHGNYTVYSQYTDANNYFQIYTTSAGAVGLNIKISGTVNEILVSSSPVYYLNQWFHLAFVENGDSYYCFVNGYLVDSSTSTLRAADYSGAIAVGVLYNGSSYSQYFAGYMDELRISIAARYTSPFTPLAYEFGSISSTVTWFNIGVSRPVAGFKFYVKATGAYYSGTVSSPTIEYWNGEGIASLTVASNTTTNMSATGVVTFADTQSLIKPSMWNGQFLYWYRFSGTSTGVPNFYLVTALENMQPVRDLWDGVERNVTGFLTYVTLTEDYIDYTIQVTDSSYASADTGTFVNIGGLTTARHFVVSFPLKTAAVHFYIPEDKGNTTANTSVRVKYWDGAAWQLVNGIEDGTSVNNISMARTGWVSWTPPIIETASTSSTPTGAEHRREIQNDVPLYYYQFSFSKALSGDVHVYYVTGMPAPVEDRPFKFPLFAMNRLFLCNATDGEPNLVKCSAADTADVWNGDDSLDIYFGDDNPLVAGGWLYGQFGSNVYNMMVFCKNSETWVLVGNSPDKWEKFRVGSSIGCTAPKTFVVVNVPYDLSPQSNRTIAIWQASDGIYIFDGRGFTPIHLDIQDTFDGTGSTVMNRSYSDLSIGWYDPIYMEYHWKFAAGSATTPDTEYAYDLRRKKWYFVSRGTAGNVQAVFPVTDTKGNVYTYGISSTGYMYQLESGYSFPSSTAITCTFASGDLALSGSLYKVTAPRRIKLVSKGKTSTTLAVTLTHYADTVSSASDTNAALVPSHATKRIVPLDWSKNYAHGVYHRFQFSYAASAERSFEPKFFAVKFDVVRDDT